MNERDRSLELKVGIFVAIGLASWVGAALVDVAIEAALR